MMRGSSPDIPPVQEGEILDGKYRVDRVLGVGGMGIVVAATHVHLNTRVAIKFLLPAAMGNPQIIERFAREARAAVQIQSEHVARVTDVGTLPTGSPYMVMEFLEGSDLAETIERSGPMPASQAVGYVLQACEAIAEAHALGIVHRDLKPANLFLARRAGRDPMVKVLDFGISKTKDAASGLTQTSSVMGSPYYMAPEQMMSSKDVDARADVWALGIILYELLTGKPPFYAETMAEVVYMVTQRDPAPLRDKRSDVPEGLVEAISKCLTRDVAQRYPNVARLAAALVPFGPARSDISLERISRVLGASMRPVADEPFEGKPHAMRATSATWARSQPGSGGPAKARLVVIGVAVGIVALIGGGVVWRVTQRGQASQGPETSTAAGTAVPSAAAPPAPAAAAVLAPLPDTTAEVPAPAKSVAAGHPTAPAAPAGKAAPIASKSKGAPVPVQPAQPPAPAPAPAPPPPPSRGGGLNMGMKD
jgi:eukaryotic-like serine/threonine-protein kinase